VWHSVIPTHARAVIWIALFVWPPRYAGWVHELSIAVSLVELASEEAGRLGDVRVEALHVRIGPLAGVVEEALRFSFDLAAEGTAIDGARLEIERVPLTIRCSRCKAERELPSAQHLRCPACAEPAQDIVRGRELELRALEVTDRAAAHR
jgi:hydrogenase nickel incorporation protein HypA/HybF